MLLCLKIEINWSKHNGSPLQNGDIIGRNRMSWFGYLSNCQKSGQRMAALLCLLKLDLFIQSETRMYILNRKIHDLKNSFSLWSVAGSVRNAKWEKTCGWTLRMEQCCVGSGSLMEVEAMVTLWSTTERPTTPWQSNWTPSHQMEQVWETWRVH